VPSNVMSFATDRSDSGFPLPFAALRALTERPCAPQRANEHPQRVVGFFQPIGESGRRSAETVQLAALPPIYCRIRVGYATAARIVH
jgi:hypothetical protein